eukprot:m.345010 g.345010  ORF g.345010 m.345010 type:complete len:148 (+) comp25623_c0_seq1:147-590(+)
MNTENYPQIQKLIDCCIEHQFTFEVIRPIRINQDHLYDEEIKMTYKDHEFIIPVDNEYEDVELNNPVVFLDMIIREVESFEESKSINEWAFNNAVKPKNREAIGFYKTLKEASPKIRSIVGDTVKSIPYFEIELNTGMAKALRQSRL